MHSSNQHGSDYGESDGYSECRNTTINMRRRHSNISWKYRWGSEQFSMEFTERYIFKRDIFDI